LRGFGPFRLLPQPLSFRQLAFAAPDQAQIVAGCGIAGVPGQDLQETGLGLVQFALEIVRETKIVAQGPIAALTRQGLLIQLLSPLKISQVLVILGQGVQDFKIIRILSDGLFQFF
jgi:hypothetical protein